MLPLISRLRASSRLCIIVLALFILKIGIAYACASNDLAKELSASSGTVQIDHSDANVGKKLTVDNDSPSSAKHAFGSCPDCNCHNITAMLPSAQGITIYISQLNYFPSAIYFKQAAIQPDFRPPII